MRKLINVPRSMQKSLNQQFSLLVNIFQNGKFFPYEKVTVSPFEKPLSKEKANELLSLENNNLLLHKQYDRQLHDFVLMLYAKNDECFLVKLKVKYSSQRPAFKQFTNDSFAKICLTPAHFVVSDMFRFVLVCPRLDFVYFEGCDFTHVVYYRSVISLKSLEKLSKFNHLFLNKC